MKTPLPPGASSPLPPAASRILLAAAACLGSAHGQTLADALDTPDREWISSGDVTVVTGAADTYDGVDALRIAPDPAGGDYTYIRTAGDGLPSALTFRHRSAAPGASVDFRVGDAHFGIREFTSGPSWAEMRLPVAPVGSIQIEPHPGVNPPGAALFDTLSLTPLPAVPLAEALDAPGLSFSVIPAGNGAYGFSDSQWAPDGSDAVWVPRSGSVQTTVPGNMVVSYTGSCFVESLAAEAKTNVQDIAGRKHFLSGPASSRTVVWKNSLRDLPVLDQVSVRPPVPPAEALDAAAGLVFESLAADPAFAAFGSPDAPPGAKNGNALARPTNPNWEGSTPVRVSGFTGPGQLRYRVSRGYLPGEAVWRTASVSIGSGVNSYVVEEPGWLDDLSFTPGGGLGAWLGLPGADVTLPYPSAVIVEPFPVGTPEETASQLRIAVRDHTSPPPELLRVGFDGPAVVSFEVANSHAPVRVSVDGGAPFTADSAPLSGGLVPKRCAVAVAGPGPHRVSVLPNLTSPGATTLVLRGLRIDPLTEPTAPLSFGDALETGSRRAWSAAGGAAAAVPALRPGGEGDSADCLVLSGSAGQPATLTTVVERPYVVRWTGVGVSLSVDGKPLIQGSTVGEWDAASGLFVQRYGETDFRTPEGPATLTFSAEAGVLDSVRIFVPLSDANAPGKRVGTNPVWTLHERTLGWLINPDHPGGPMMLSSSLFAGAYAEASVTGPALLPAPYGVQLSLPDMGREVFSGVPFPGQHRVLLEPSSADNWNGWLLPQVTPGISPGAAAGAPELTWETGGDAPWVGVAGTDGQPTYARSELIDRGEESWIQVTVTGPGVLRWRKDRDSEHGFSLNGRRAAEPAVDGGCYLHLPAGTHRVRWWAYTIENVFPRRASAVLREVGYEPAPSPTWQEVSGQADKAFFFALARPLPAALPLWSSLNAWTGVTADGRAGALLHRPVDMIPVLPSPGEYDLTTMTRPTDPPTPFAPEPYPWKSITLRAPRGEAPAGGLPQPGGLETLAGAATWRPSAEVSLAEALDTPDLVWTTGSGGASAWRGYSGHSAGAEAEGDPDAAHFRAEDAFPEAWLETRVTGPARMDILWSQASTQRPAAPGAGFQVLIDGAEASANYTGMVHSAPPHPQSDILPVNVPPGEHTVRLHWAPGVAGSAVLPVISRVILTPLEAGPDIGALVDAPALPWLETGLRVSAAAAADTWDGVDAARLTVTPGRLQPSLTTTVTGPGIFTARIDGAIMNARPYGGTWVPEGGGYGQKAVVLPPGRQFIRFTPFDTIPGLVDTVRWEPLPALTPAQALAIVTPSAGSPLPFSLYEGAVYTGYPAGNPDSVLIPGDASPFWLRVPGECRVTFSARLLPVGEGEPEGSLFVGPMPAEVSADRWTTTSINSDWAYVAPGGLLYLHAAGQAVLIRDIVITPYDGYYFLPAMKAAGLTGAAAAGGADPDGDGVANVLEHAFGLNAAKPDAAGISSGTGRYGLPEVSIWRNPETGLDYLTVRWRGRMAGAEYQVETARAGAAGEALQWTTATEAGWWDVTEVPGAPEWWDFFWRSNHPLGADGPRFVRVRAFAQ